MTSRVVGAYRKCVIASVVTVLLLIDLAAAADPSRPRGARRPSQGSLPLKFSVQENQPRGTIVGKLGVDAANVDDGGKKTFNLLGEHVEEGQSGPGASSGGSGGQKLFTVDSATGVLRTAAVLDREALCSGRWSTSCDVSLDVAVSPGFSVVKVVVSVEDENDNAPTFGQSRVVRQILESAPVGALLQLPAAVDADGGAENGVVAYRLEPEGSPFAVRQPAGGSDLTLELLKPLDREQTDRYQLTVVAFDGGSPPKSSALRVEVVVDDVNDNSPRFDADKYDVTLSPSAAVGTEVVRVSATDADQGDNGAVSYKFATKTQSRYGRMFSINALTGIVQTADRVDFGSSSTITLVVLAEDRGLNSVPSSVAVAVRAADTNDHPPVIAVETLAPGRAEIAENSPPGSYVAHVLVTDQDTGRSGEVECVVVDGDADEDYDVATTPPSDNFSLIALYGNEFKLVGARSFDRERRDRYDVTVRCVDRGTPPMTSTARVAVVVTDVDDNAPAFSASTYNFTVTENNVRGQRIGQVTATDADSGANGAVVYSLDASVDVSAWFSVDASTGVLAARVPFDREFVDRFEFDVVASTSGGKSAVARVRVVVADVDDEPPRFARSWYRFDVAENQSAGTEVGRVTAVDEDMAPFNGFLYHLETSPLDDKGTSSNGGGGSQFAVDPVTGVIYTRQTLDREALSHYTLRVRAQSDVTSAAGQPLSDVAVVFVRVTDVNDNAPEVTYPTPADRTVRIRRRSDIRSGATVAVVTAHDRDAGQNAALTYSISAGDDRHRFAVDPTTGVIRWRDVHDLNRTTARGGEECNWTLTVLVKDGGLTRSLSTTAMLDVVVDGCETPSGAVVIGGVPSAEIAHRHSGAADADPSKRDAQQQQPLIAGLTDWHIFVVAVVLAGCVVVVGTLITVAVAVRQCASRRRRPSKPSGGSATGTLSAGIGVGDLEDAQNEVQLRLLRGVVDYASTGGSKETVGIGSDGEGDGSGSGGRCVSATTGQMLMMIEQQRRLGREDIAGLIMALRQAQLQSRYQDSRLQIPRDRDTDSGCVDLSPVM